jgi:hypothetical protein
MGTLVVLIVTSIKALLVFLGFFNEPHSLAHHQVFWNIGSPMLYIYTYIWKFNFGQIIWGKSVVLLGTY